MSEIEFPEYHEQGMGCGLEDQGITDRYEACRYGYEQALEDVNNEVIIDLENQLKTQQAEIERLRRFEEAVSTYIDGYILNNNSLHAMSRIMKHHDKLNQSDQ